MKAAVKFAAVPVFLGIALFLSGCGGEEDRRGKGREYRDLMDDLRRVFVEEVEMMFDIESKKAIDEFYDMSEEDKDKAIERLKMSVKKGREVLRKKPFRGGLLMRWIKSGRENTSGAVDDENHVD